MPKLRTYVMKELRYYFLTLLIIQIFCFEMFSSSMALAKEDQKESDFFSIGGIQYREKTTQSQKALIHEKNLQSQIDKLDSYLIGPEDILNILVWRNENLNHQVIVRPDGKISFPLIGDVQAGDRTPEDLRQEISLKLEEFIPNPTVTVMVERINSIRIYIIGNIPNPGEFVIGKRINVLQALSKAGGLSDFADEKKIFIIRTMGRRQIKLPFNYKEITEGKRTEQNIYLETGDVIVVP